MSGNRYKWVLIGVLWWICLLNYADRQAIFVLFSQLKSEFHISDMQLALVGSSFMWTYAVFGAAAGWLGDRLSRKGLVLAGVFAWMLTTTATFLSHDYWQLILLCALSGISEAVNFPAAMSLISHYHGPNTRSRAMSIHQSTVYAGTIAGGVTAPILALRWGWRASFISFDCFGFCIFLLAAFLLHEPERAKSSNENNAGQITERRLNLAFNDVLTSPLVLRLVATFIGANFIAAGFMVGLPSFLYRHYHLSLSMAGMDATLYLQVASIAGLLCSGILADGLAGKSKEGRMHAQAIGLFSGAPFLFLIGVSRSVYLAVLGTIGFGFCEGIYDSNIWASLHDVVRPELHAVAVGITNALGWLGTSIAPNVIAWSSRRIGMQACLSSTSLVYLGVAALLLFNSSHTERFARTTSLFIAERPMHNRVSVAPSLLSRSRFHGRTIAPLHQANVEHAPIQPLQPAFAGKEMS